MTDYLHVGGVADGKWLPVAPNTQYVRQTVGEHTSVYHASRWHADGEEFLLYAEEDLSHADVLELLMMKYSNANRC